MADRERFAARRHAATRRSMNHASDADIAAELADAIEDALGTYGEGLSHDEQERQQELVSYLRKAAY